MSGMTTLMFAKISMVLTVIFAGWNVREMMDSFQVLSARVDELKRLITEEQEKPVFNPFGIAFYMFLPLTYLVLLQKAAFPQAALMILGVKLGVTVAINLWVARIIFNYGGAGQGSRGEAVEAVGNRNGGGGAGNVSGFTRMHFMIGRTDNLLNVLFALAVITLLLLPDII